MIPADVAADRFERLRMVVERSALARHQARVGRTEEILVEGPSKRDPAVVSGRTAQGKLVHVPAAPGTLPGRHLGGRPDHPGRAALPDRRAAGGHGPAHPSHPHPGGGRLSRHPIASSRRMRPRRRRRSGRSGTRRDPASGPGGLHGVREVGAGAGAGPPARRRRGGHRRLHAGLPGHGHRHRQADPGRAGRDTAPSPRSGRPGGGVEPDPLGGRGPAGRGRASKPGVTGPCWSGEPACTSRRWWTACARRAATRRCDDSSKASPTPPPCYRRLEEVDPLAASRMEPSNRRRIIRALEVTLGSGRPFSSFGPGAGRVPGHHVADRRAVAAPVGRGPPDRGPAGRHAPGRAGRRGGGPAGRTAGAVTHRPPGPRLPGGARPPRGRGAARDRRWPRPCGAPGPSPGASGCGGGGTPGCGGTAPSITRSPSCPSCWETGRTMTALLSCRRARPDSKLHGLGNDFLVVLDAGAAGRCVGPAGAPAPAAIRPSARPGDAGRTAERSSAGAVWPGGSCDRHLGIGADGLILGTRLAAGPTAGPTGQDARLRFQLWNADGSEAEMSGNGIRCLAHAALDAGWVAEGVPFGVITPAGRREVTIRRGVGAGLDLGDGGDGRSQGPGRGRSLQRRARSAARRHRQPASGGPRPRPGHGRCGRAGPAAGGHRPGRAQRRVRRPRPRSRRDHHAGVGARGG